MYDKTFNILILLVLFIIFFCGYSRLGMAYEKSNLLGTGILRTDSICNDKRFGWPLLLRPLCQQIHNNLSVRDWFFRNIVVHGLGACGLKDAQNHLKHYLTASGRDMHIGKNLGRLIQENASPHLEQWLLTKILPDIISAINGIPEGRSLKIGPFFWSGFFSNANDDPGFSLPKKIWIALGGFDLEISLIVQIEKVSSSILILQLEKYFFLEKLWDFAPKFHDKYNDPSVFYLSPDTALYIPDEWLLSLELEGLAKRFTLLGNWHRVETLKMVKDENKNTWILYRMGTEAKKTASEQRLVGIKEVQNPKAAFQGGNLDNQRQKAGYVYNNL